MKVEIGYSQKSSAEEAAIESIRGTLKIWRNARKGNVFLFPDGFTSDMDGNQKTILC